MKRPIPRSWLSWLVAGLASAMAAGIVAEAWPAARDSATSDSRPPSALPLTATAAADAPPIDDWVEAALGRPLFAADRRPDAAAAVPEQALPRLSGTIRLADTVLAMFQPVSTDGTAKTVVVGEGAELSGWTITDITSDGVTLMRGERIASLRLSYANRVFAPRHLGVFPTRVLHDKRTSPFLQP